MSLKIIGDSGYEADVNTDKALYVESRPISRGQYGAFSSGLWNSNQTDVNLISTDNLWSIIWTAPTGVCLVRRIRFGYYNAGITSPVQIDCALFFARSFTGLPTTNLTNRITSFGSNVLKLRRTSLSSNVGFLSVTSGDAMGGTYTPDAQPLVRLSTWTGTTAGNSMFGSYLTPLLDRTGYGQYPVVLAKNEGLIITCPTANSGVSPSGGWMQVVNVDWQEAPGY